MAELQYLVPSNEAPVYYASEGGKEAKLDMAGEFEMRRVPIHNGRYRFGMWTGGVDFSLDQEGFTLVPHVSAIRNF